MRFVRVIAISLSASLFVSAGSAMADDDAPKPVKPAPKPKKKKAAAPKKDAPKVEETVAAPPPPAPETKVAAASPPVVTAPVPHDEPKNADKPDFSSADKPFSVAPLLGFGTGGTRYGIGIRAGYNITEHIYVGGQFMYHFGYSYFGVESASLFYPSAEMGYDFKAVHGRLDIRPYGGVGLLVSHVSSPALDALGVSTTGTALGIYPGVSITYDIPNVPIYVGGDARLLFSTAGSDPSFGMFASGGLRF